MLTMTTSSENEQEVEQLVHRLSPNASRIYHISGTQKFELPKQELKIADVFHAVESAKSRFSIYVWSLVDTKKLRRPVLTEKKKNILSRGPA